MQGVDRTKAPEPEIAARPLTGERYYSREFAQAEWDHMWTKDWLIGGLESEVPESGDFIT